MSLDRLPSGRQFFYSTPRALVTNNPAATRHKGEGVGEPWDPSREPKGRCDGRDRPRCPAGSPSLPQSASKELALAQPVKF